MRTPKRLSKYYSEIDTNGKLRVDCIECERGRFGDVYANTCACGYKYGKHGHGCYIGSLMPHINKDKIPRILKKGKECFIDYRIKDTLFFALKNDSGFFSGFYRSVIMFFPDFVNSLHDIQKIKLWKTSTGAENCIKLFSKKESESLRIVFIYVYGGIPYSFDTIQEFDLFRKGDKDNGKA